MVKNETINNNFSAHKNNLGRLLHPAAFERDISKAIKLIEQCVNIESKNNYGETPLYDAVRYKKMEMVKYLVDNGTNLQHVSNSGDTPLHHAIHYGQSEIAQYLIKSKKANLDAINNDGDTALHLAVRNNDMKTLELLIKEGADVNIQNREGNTPLFESSCWGGNITAAKYLVNAGADVNIGSVYGPLAMATGRGNVEIAKLLIDNGANALSKSKALLNATDNIDLTRYLIERNTDVSYKNNIGDTSLHHAAYYGNLETIQYLLKQGAVLDCKNIVDRTPLINAISRGDIDIIKYLVEAGADINIQMKDGYSPLHKAVINGNLDIIKLLISKGAKLEIYNNCGQTPLSFAKDQGKKEIIDYMDNIALSLSCNKAISLDNTNINIKYDLAANKLDTIEKSIKDAVRDFRDTFNTSDHDIKINVYVFNTRNDFKEYLKKINFNIGNDVVGYTQMIDLNKGNAADVYVFLDSKGNVDQHTLEHEIGHAMHFANLGLSYILPRAMNDAIANYVAGLENGKHINDHGDKEALIAIKDKNLKLDEILRNDYRGDHYYSEAEQVVKFLEYKHPDLIDNLLKSLSAYERHDELQANKLVEDFLTKLKGYDREFREWVQVQLSDKEYLEYEDRVSSIQDDKAEQSDNEERKMSKKSIKEDKVKQEEISVIDSTEDDTEKDLNHSLKVKMDKPVSEKLSNKFEEGSNQVGAKLTINNEKVDEEIVAENEIKSKKKEVDEEDKGDTEESNNSLNIQTNNEDEIVELQEGSMLQEAQERTAILIVEVDNLLESLSNYEYHNIDQSKKSIEDFLVKLEGYTQELRNWIKDELNSEGHKYVKANQPDYSNEVQDESVSQEIPQNVGLYGYSSVNHISSDKIKVEAKSSISRENDMQADQSASEERSKRLIREDEEKQEKTTIIDNVNGNQEELQHSLKIKMGEAIGGGKYKVVLKVQDQDIDNFYQNLSSNYTAGKYNHDQMIALYDKVYIQDSKLDGKPITLSEAYVTDDHLFIKNQDFGNLNDFNEMFYKSDVFM